MKYNFEEHILDLLKHNDCVTIPGFGGFLLKAVPSSIQGNTISPPSKKLAFNSVLTQDDELLTGAIMGKHGLSFETAKNEVLAFSHTIQYELKKNKQFSFKRIGAFTVSADNRIVFKPFLLDFPAKDSFGFKPFHAERLPKEIIKKETKSVRESIYSKQETRKTKVRKTNKLPIIGLVSSVLLMASMIGFMASPKAVAPAATQEAGFVNLLFPTDSFVKSFDNEAAWTEVFTNAPLSPKEGQEYGSLLELNRKDLVRGYYLVLGSYASQVNAERMEAQLFEQGFDSYVFPAENGFYRVGVFASTQYLQAKEMLLTSLADHKDAWLIKN